MNITTYQVDAFTKEPFSGNPAMVVTEADDLSDDIMQLVASEIYLSETTFIIRSGSKDSSFRFRFFTHSEEIDMSGHAVIAACYTLINEGRILLDDGITKVYVETNIGSVPVNIYFRKSELPDKTADNSDCVTPPHKPPRADILIYSFSNSGLFANRAAINPELNPISPTKITRYFFIDSPYIIT